MSTDPKIFIYRAYYRAWYRAIDVGHTPLYHVDIIVGTPLLKSVERNGIFEEAENLKIKLGSWFDVSKTKIASTIENNRFRHY